MYYNGNCIIHTFQVRPVFLYCVRKDCRLRVHYNYYFYYNSSRRHIVCMVSRGEVRWLTCLCSCVAMDMGLNKPSPICGHSCQLSENALMHLCLPDNNYGIYYYYYPGLRVDHYKNRKNSFFCVGMSDMA